MNLAAACGWTLLRSLLVALVAVPLSRGVWQELASLGGRARTLLWTLLLIPFFTPALLTGFGYSSFSLSLIQHPGWNEALYGAVVGLRSLAVGVVVMYFAPPPSVSAQALHCAKLAVSHTIGSPLRRLFALWPWLIRGPWRVAFPAAAVVFLFAFQEFETASLMGTTTWTVWLFDAQAGGLMLVRSLRAALLPAGCELLVLILLLVFAFRSQFLPGPAKQHSVRPPVWLQWLAWGLPLAGCVVVLAVPLALIGRDMFQGLLAVLVDRQVYEEIFIAVGFGLASAVPATLAAGLLLRVALRGTANGAALTVRAARISCVLLSIPGMIGSLAVSLGLLWLFQRPVLNAAYDTTFPTVLALFLYLLPRALLLLLLFEAVTRQQGVHTVRLLQSAPDPARRNTAAELLWQMRYRRYFLVAGILCIWGYLELTPVSILAPPGVTSAPVRLYNLMHYGRSMVLSAMVMLAMLVPPGLWFLLSILRKPLFRVFRRFQQTFATMSP